MRGVCVSLLAVVAVVHARSTAGQMTSVSSAAPGESPYLVHLRIAVSTSGLLYSCVGSLYTNSLVLTAASCLKDARFIWIRYGAVDVIKPELVTETSSVTIHPEYNQLTGDNDIAVIRINRIVQSTDNIRTIPVASRNTTLPSSGKLCAYGSVDGRPGEQLKCKELRLEASDRGRIIAKEGKSSQFDLGAPLVSDGVQYGVLVGAGASSEFLKSAQYKQWLDVQPGGVGSPVVVLDI